MSNLDYVTTEELIDELHRRCEASVMCFIPLCETERHSCRFKGSRIVTMGLIHAMRLYAEDDLVRAPEIPLSDEDGEAPEQD